MTGNRTTRVPKEQKKRTRRIITALVVLGLGLFSGIQVIRGIVAFGQSAFRRDPLGMVVKTDPAVVFWFNTTDEKTIALIIPNDVLVDATRGYGAYALGKLWRLGEIEKRDGSLITETVQELLGVPVADWFATADLKSLPAESATQTIDAARSFISSSFIRADSNLSLLERALIAYRLVRLDSTRIMGYSLSSLGVLILSTLPDDTPVSNLDEKQFDTVFADSFELNAIRQNSLSIEIRNATQISGLGNRVARFITHLGGSVVRVGNSNHQEKSCVLEMKENYEKTKLVQVLTKTYGCLAIENKENQEDITLIIGQSYADFLMVNNTSALFE